MERWAIRVGGGMLAFAIAVEAFLAIRGDPFGIGFGGLVPLISVGAFGTFVLFVLARDRLR